MTFRKRWRSPTASWWSRTGASASICPSMRRARGIEATPTLPPSRGASSTTSSANSAPPEAQRAPQPLNLTGGLHDRPNRCPLVHPHPRRRTLSRLDRGRPRDRSAVSEADRPGRRRSRLLWRPLAHRALLRRLLGDRLGAGALDEAPALFGGGASRSAGARRRGAHGRHPRPHLGWS